MFKEQQNITPIQRFQLFGLESYRIYNKYKGSQALQDFIATGAFDFLNSGYDVLHTQSQGFIVGEINEYIKNYYASISRKH